MTAFFSGAEAAIPAQSALSAFESIVEHRYVTHNGVRIHYAVAGEGPLIVFLHGFPDHWLGWWQVMDSLRSGYRVAALDLRGYNLSDKPAGPDAYKVERLVEDVQAVVANEKSATATIVGHDWGGFLAWHVAMDVPSMVDGLVVLSMPHPWAIARELANNPAQRAASEYVRLFRQPESHLHFPLDRLGAWVNDIAYRERHDQAMALSSLDGMLSYYRANWPVEPYTERTVSPPKVQAPTLLIQGLQDPYALPAGLNDIWQWVDNEVDIYTMPYAAHFIQHDYGLLVARRLRQWLLK